MKLTTIKYNLIKKKFEKKSKKNISKLKIIMQQVQQGGTFVFDSKYSDQTGIYYGVIYDVNLENEEFLKQTDIIKIKIFKDQNQLTWQEIINLWKSNNAFIDFFRDLFKQCRFENYFWECPPIKYSDIQHQLFEFVLIKYKEKFPPANSNDFKEHFENTKQGSIINFLNLNGQSMLIVPIREKSIPNNAYSCICTFLRETSKQQIHKFWNKIAIILETRLKQNRHNYIWLSTDGRGVPWLHVRLDPTPKYYKMKAYKK